MMTQPEKIEHILTKSAEYFGRDRKELYAPDIKDRTFALERRLILYILANNTNLLQWEIAQRVGYRQHNMVNLHYKRVQDELSDGVYGYDKIKMLYKELNEYIGL